MKFLHALIIVVIACTLQNLQAAPTVKIHKIVVKGNKIIEDAAIRSKITSRKGQNYQLHRVRKDVKNLFNTGWFYDIEVDFTKNKKNSGILTYRLKEKPIVEKFTYEGNYALGRKELDKIFNFSSHAFLNHNKIQKAIQTAREAYEKKGYYLAEISYSIKKTNYPEKIQVEIQIKENNKVRIKKINFIGNRTISSETIKSFMGTREANLFSFLFSSGSYSQSVLETDLNNIRFIYLDKGYWKVHVGHPQLTVSPDRKDIVITIPIQEGEQYKTGSVYFSENWELNTSELKRQIKTKELEVFSYGKLQKDIQFLQAKYGDKGYAFANVIPKFFLKSDEDKNVHVLFDVQKGKKVKIRKIGILGNSYTRDKVIRREIRVYEQELYNETNKKVSLENIRRLGFFDDVKFLPKTIKGRDDLVDMEVTIKERENTGTLDLGISYAGLNGFSFTGKVHKVNLFGRGYKAGIDTNLNFNRQYVNVNFSDPYFLDSNWYFGTDFYLDQWSDEAISQDIFKQCNEYDKMRSEQALKNLSQKPPTNQQSSNTPNQNPSTENQADNLEAARQSCVQSLPNALFRGFTEHKMSGGLTLGRSLTDTIRLLFYYRLEKVRLENSIDPALFPVEKASGIRNPVEFIMEYDKRNDRMFPTNGFYSRNSIAYDGFFGKFSYFTLSLNTRFYHELIWGTVFRVNAQYSEHISFDGDPSGVPFDRLFRLGGINSLRGFKYFSVGPRRRSQVLLGKAHLYKHPHPQAVADRVFGGLKEFYTNLELQFAIFSASRFFGVVFVDIGTSYNDMSNIDLRGNWGFGVRAITPIAPVRVEIGFPFSPRADMGEGFSHFDFTMGVPF